ncbi:alpha-galactosidase [Spirosoma sp. KCTC 42546]|uniref:alpha-galactosidase n=1 Tax=Spirosoma sp. KCTC 42546 TaxID=2520506 RepID=UPI00115B09A2|nr:alpha-galactosidase [Spirosoma sp. KCTC 42546]QDK78262.1 alpha-galactosidase [Spirosoma sp. KCTC 42546]
MNDLSRLLACWLLATTAFAQLQNLPVYQPTPVKQDWLLTPVTQRAGVYRTNSGKDLVLSNGLLTRRFRISPNLATVDYQNLVTGEQFVRSVRPEAMVTLNGKTYRVGGLYGQKEHAYLREEWLADFTANPADFQFKTFTVSPLQPYINWKSRTWTLNKKQPTGQEVTLFFSANAPELQGVEVAVHYALYDGIPTLSKWVTIQNKSQKSLHINQVISEILATPEEESAVVGKPEQMKKPQRIYIENNFAFNNAMRYDLSDQATHWKTDSLYTSQVNYNYETPCLLEVYPTVGVGIDLAPDQTYNSIHSYELLLDSYDRERNGLARRQFYRTVTPWTTQNPIFMHLVSTDPVVVKRGIDQCAETGYELVILSFGSGLNMEDASDANIQKFKALADYAHSKGILLGGYSLFSSRRIDDENDVIDPKTGLPDKGAFFGNAPCLASQWGINYLNSLKKFITETGFDLLEHDGPYPGDVCASTKHPGHKGLDDSQWVQMEMQKGFYRSLNEKGVYINAPDWYFMDGSNKIGLGYREVNFSLSREQQKLLNRQNIFDGTWEKTPAMGWGFVPLTKYQGGGPEAVLEPLSEHLTDYEQLMVQYYGAGVQACYRGPRLYDTDATKQTVQQVISWYKKYRPILNSDLIHLRRPDGRDWDGIMHVNPALKEKGVVMLFNPLKTKITRTIKLPLYYTGLRETAQIRKGEGKPKSYKLNRNYEVEIPVEIGPESYGWWVVE